MWQRQPEDRYWLDTPPSDSAAPTQEAGASSATGQPEAERELDDAQLNSSDFDVDTDWEEDDEDPDSSPTTPAKAHTSQVEEPSTVESGSELPSIPSTPAIPEGELTGEVDWAALDAEVDAAMDEDDEDEDDDENGHGEDVGGDDDARSAGRYNTHLIFKATLLT